MAGIVAIGVAGYFILSRVWDRKDSQSNIQNSSAQTPRMVGKMDQRAIDRVDKFGSAQVLVTLKGNQFTDIGVVYGTKEEVNRKIEAQGQEVLKIQDRVLRELPGAPEIVVMNKFTSSPLLKLKVNKSGLEKLNNHPEVIDISVDEYIDTFN